MSAAAPRVIVFTALALLAFAGNSLLCRLALRDGGIDAASFTAIRLAAGALALLALTRGRAWRAGSWRSAAALFVYAIAFSCAYLGLPAAGGALLLFGAVQASMIGAGLYRGERLTALQWLGFALALGGLVGLVLPGLSAPPPGAALLMILAGIAWGVYSLRGRGGGDPLQATAGNFLRAAVPGVLVVLVPHEVALGARGVACALASGAITSGIGYAIWYSALPHLRATQAATVQLAVPVIAALGGAALLGEAFTLRLLLAGVAILAGVGVVVLRR